MTDATKLAIERAWDRFCDGFDSHSNGWLDKGSDEMFEAGYLAALRAQPESACPECHCHFTATEVTAPGSTRLVNTAQPDHSELVKELRNEADGELHFETSQLFLRAANALEGKAIGETK